MREIVDERGALRLFLDACMKCGACTDKCHYFLGTGDPKNMPVARQDLFRDVYRRYHTLSGRLVPWLVGAKKLTPEMLDDWYTYFHQCSQCRRCAVYCPVGIDTAEFAMAAREVMDRIGIGQHYTNDIVEKAGRLGNNLGLPGPALADTLAGLEEDILEETGVAVRLPLDERGADLLLVTPSADFFAEPHVDGLIGYAKVFHQAGLSWTLSTQASEAANFALFMGNREHLAALARRIVEAARRLGASRIVFGECGHAWRVGHNHLETLAGPLDFLARGADALPERSQYRPAGGCRLLHSAYLLRLPRLKFRQPLFQTVRFAAKRFRCGGGAHEFAGIPGPGARQNSRPRQPPVDFAGAASAKQSLEVVLPSGAPGVPDRRGESLPRSPARFAAILQRCGQPRPLLTAAFKLPLRFPGRPAQARDFRFGIAQPGLLLMLRLKVTLQPQLQRVNAAQQILKLIAPRRLPAGNGKEQRAGNPASHGPFRTSDRGCDMGLAGGCNGAAALYRASL